MGRPGTTRSTLLTVAALCTAAAGLFIAPARLQQCVRAAVLDAVVTGQSVAINQFDVLHASASRSLSRLSADDALSARTSVDDRQRKLEQVCRRLRVENARLRDELRLTEKYGVSPLPVSTADTVDVPNVVRATVVSRHTLSEWRSVRPLNQGRSAGITESALVLEQDLPHLDQGSDAGIEPDLDVFIGRCVVGRIASVGRWTSTMESITDPRYRALAQIVRPTDQGGTFGTEGILVGAGNGMCKLTDVPTTETVRIGDEVYTSDRDRRTGVPLYYGRIRSVEESGRHWVITVEPAVKVDEIKSVAVLKLPPTFVRTLAE